MTYHDTDRCLVHDGRFNTWDCPSCEAENEFVQAYEALIAASLPITEYRWRQTPIEKMGEPEG